MIEVMQGIQDNQATQENVVEVVLEEYKVTLDTLDEAITKWQVVDQSSGLAKVSMPSISSDERHVIGHYKLVLEGDFGESDMVLVRRKDYEKTYFLYKVKNGQLVRATGGGSTTSFGDWMFQPSGVIRRTLGFSIAPGQVVYFKALKGNWDWPQVIKEAVSMAADIFDGLDKVIGNYEDDFAGYSAFQALDEFIKTRQQATEVVRSVFGIVSQLLEPDIAQNQLAALVKSRESTIQGPAGRVVNQLHKIVNACQEVDPNLQLPEKHLRPKGS